MTTSAAGRFSVACMSTGMPRPLSITVTLLSSWTLTLISSQEPARASSTELSTTSQTRWCSPCSPVEPMYIAGRLRTASRSPSTLIEVASYRCPGLLPITVSFSPMLCTSPCWRGREGCPGNACRERKGPTLALPCGSGVPHPEPSGPGLCPELEGFLLHPVRHGRTRRRLLSSRLSRPACFTPHLLMQGFGAAGKPCWAPRSLADVPFLEETATPPDRINSIGFRPVPQVNFATFVCK